MIRKSLISLLGLFWAGAVSADWGFNMPRGVTELSAETFDLHMMVFWWCVAIGIVVFGVMIISLFKHRKSKGVEPADFLAQHDGGGDLDGTPGSDPVDHGRACSGDDDPPRRSRNPDVSIVVTAYQWKWHYKYQDEEIEFYSNLDRPSLEARPKGSGIDPFDVDNFLLEVDHPPRRPQVGAKDPPADHLERRRALLVGARLSRSRRTPFRASSTRPGSGPNRPARSAASARNFAARITATCRSSSRSSSPTHSSPGSRRSRNRASALPRANK